MTEKRKGKDKRGDISEKHIISKQSILEQKLSPELYNIEKLPF